MQGRALLRARFGPQKSSIGEIESSQAARRRDFRSAFAPMEAASNHQVEHEPNVILEPDTNALTHTAQSNDCLTFDRTQGRRSRSQQERTRNSHMLEMLAENAFLEGFDVDDNIGEFGHGFKSG